MDVNEALALVRDLSPEERANLQATVAQSPSISLWSPLPGPQTQAYTSEADEVFYGGAAGGGKALLNQEVIATPYGYREIGALQIGDRVLAADGTMTQVIGVYPQGERPIFRVSFSDGGFLDADAGHLWNYSVAHKGKWRKSGREWKVATTDQLRSMIESGRTLLVPLCEPLKFNKSYRYDQRTVDPYLLGLLLGDGCLRGNSVKLSSADPFIFENLEGTWTQSGAYDYSATGETRAGLLEKLRALGAHGFLAHEKTIPEAYLWGSVEDRYALLQGLMDTDGTCTPDGKAYFTSTSKVLADQVRWLAFSLGGRATLTDKQPFYRDKAGERVDGRTAYTCYIRMPDNRVLFRLPRKRDLASLYNGGALRENGPVTLKRRITSIQFEGYGETTCIRIDHPSSLYVAGKDLVVTHNSALIVGMALTKHRRTLIIRRESTQLRGLIDDIARTLKTRDGLNNQAGQWRIPAAKSLFPDQLIEFGGVPNPGDEERHQGIPHDLLAFDEVTQLTEYVINYLTTWNRTIHPEQPCRMILTSNPPTPSTQYGIRGRSSGGGTWIVRRYAPWLNPQYRDPHGLGKAEPGELRWFVTLDGVEQEWPDPLPFVHYDSKNRREEIIQPRSRTFIPALASQNPYTGDAYIATLQKLPEPLRSALLYGDFSVSLTDQPLQLFPSDWVRSATLRHSSTPMPGYPGYPPSDTSRRMTAIGADIARGGADTTVLMLRYGQWFAPPILLSKAETADGPSAGAAIVKHRRDQAQIVIDANGVGASVYDHLRNNAPDDGNIKAHVGSVASTARDRSNRYGFTNRRSEVYWKLREALDPSSPYQLCIPNDEELIEELLSLTWEEQSGRIKVMSKKDHIQVLGRSPDKADALTLAWSVRDDEDPQEDRAMTAREERLADARGEESWHRGSGEPGRRKARWSDAVLSYPKRW